MAGTKTEEYRQSSTSLRGRIYIYASLTLTDRDELPYIVKSHGLTIDEIEVLPRGVIIGTVELYDCKQTYSGYDWLLRNPKRAKRLLKPKIHPQPVWFYPFSLGGN